MKDIKNTKKRYIVINIIMVGLAAWLLFLPERYDSSELEAGNLLVEMNRTTRYLSTDYVADKIVSQDKFTMLIDLRTPEEYNEFHLQGAINIPLANILDKDEEGDYAWEYILNQDIYTNVFYSNGTVYASQAWMLLRRLNFKNNYIMEGGLNEWFNTIIYPPHPGVEASDAQMAQYTFRQAASLYFGGAAPQSSSSAGTPMPVVKKKNNKKEEGGC